MTEARETADKLLNTPVIYVASAGTGKTYQLIEGFYRALAACGFDPSRVLALTFTENAAEEMRERIRLKLLAERGLSALPLAEELSLGTIHSFCGAELRRHALLAGISPEFTVLDEPESTALARQALLAVFMERFDGKSKRERSALVREVRFNSYFRSSNFGVSLESEVLRLYHQLRARGIFDFSALQLETAECKWDEAKSDLLKSVDGLLGVAPEEMGGKSAKKLAALQVMLRSRYSELKALEPNRRGFHILEALASPINLRGSKRYQELLGTFRDETLRRCQLEIMQAGLAPVRDELLSILVELDNRFSAEKAARCALDFEDLQLKFLQLLKEQPEVAERYRGRFAKIFVDEFQDTNPLQVALVDCLADREAQFIVGDPKQSIYGFRFAEPNGIIQKRDAFAECGAVKVLRKNYRSRTEILSFVNELFRSLGGGESRLPLGFAYDDLHAAHSFAEKQSPCVQIVCTPSSKEDALEAERRQLLEADWVAGHIRETVERELIPNTQPDGSGSLGYGDFAILVRRNHLIPVFEKALARAGIPFVSEASSGFLETPEIAALNATLQLLLTPQVDMLAAEVLRSDIVGISSRGLFEIAASRVSSEESTESFFDVLERSDSILSDEADRAAMQEFRSWFNALSSRAPLLTAAEVVGEVITASRLREKLVAHGSPHRALSNLAKFSDIALSVRGRGFPALHSLTSRFRELSYQATPVGEMWTEAGDFVRIMSVHKAKGLTLRAVILAGVNYRMPSARPSFVVQPSEEDERFRLGVRHWLANPTTGDERFYAESVAEVQASAEAEELRLLYVALTRAVEHLVIVGVPTPEAGKLSSNPWGHCLRGVLHRNDDGTLVPASHFAGLVKLTELKPDDLVEEGTPISAYPSVAELAAECAQRIQKDDETLARELAAEAGKPPDISQYERYVFSVSEFLAWAGGKGDSELPALRGNFPDEDAGSDRRRDYAPAEESGEEAREVGILVHELLAEVCTRLRGLPATDALQSALSPEFLHAWMPERVESVERRREQLLPLLRSFVESELFAQLKEARAVCPEFGFLFRHSETLFRGRIDLLFILDSDAVLVDYKSDRIDGGSSVEETVSRYRDQMLFYARAAKALHPTLRLTPSLFLLDGGINRPFSFADSDFAALDARLEEFIRLSSESLRQDFLASKK